MLFGGTFSGPRARVLVKVNDVFVLVYGRALLSSKALLKNGLLLRHLEILAVIEQKSNERRHIEVQGHVISDLIRPLIDQCTGYELIPNKPA